MGLLDFLNQFFRKKVKLEYNICFSKNSASFGTPVIQIGQWVCFEFAKTENLTKSKD